MKKYIIIGTLLGITACNSGSEYSESRISEPATRIVEYTPAPGQFINSTEAGFDPTNPITSAAEACSYAEQRLATNGYVSLGGWGGYIVAEFDTPVSNTGDYDLYVTGNAFDGSSEAGVVYVAQRENGQPKTWYELQGSAFRETIRGYEITYTGIGTETIAWTDNQGGSGTIDRIESYHTQSYLPAWVATRTYRGVRLPDNVRYDEGRLTYIMQPFEWGYADNRSTIDAVGLTNRFRIADAVDAAGNPISLNSIDYIKIQTGVNCKAGNEVGEISTEVCRIGCYRTIIDKE